MGQSARHEIRFLLNGETIALDRVSPTETLLDYLRLSARLRGTKEGCGEARLRGLHGAGRPGCRWRPLFMKAVNACIRFVGSLDGCHVVTIEYLRGADGDLHPVQKAMVEFPWFALRLLHPGLRQCRFMRCGCVIRGPPMRQSKRHCRTIPAVAPAMRAIMRAARAISDYGNVAQDPLAAERAHVLQRLTALRDGARVEVGAGK